MHQTTKDVFPTNCLHCFNAAIEGRTEFYQQHLFHVENTLGSIQQYDLGAHSAFRAFLSQQCEGFSPVNVCIGFRLSFTNSFHWEFTLILKPDVLSCFFFTILTGKPLDISLMNYVHMIFSLTLTSKWTSKLTTNYRQNKKIIQNSFACKIESKQMQDLYALVYMYVCIWDKSEEKIQKSFLMQTQVLCAHKSNWRYCGDVCGRLLKAISGTVWNLRIVKKRKCSLIAIAITR